MQCFFADLSHDEKALLSHVCMQYMDRLYEEHELDSEANARENRNYHDPDSNENGYVVGSISHWSNGNKRVDYDLVINGTPLTISGFQKVHPDFGFNYSRKDSDPIGQTSFTFMANCCHYRPDNEFQKASEALSHPSFGAMTSGRHQGGFDLFDHPVMEQHAISLSVYDADLYGPRDNDPTSEVRVSGGVQLWDVKMSDAQYVRMIRGEFTEVPCTISRCRGYLNDAPDNQYMETTKLRSDVEAKVVEITKSVMGDLNELYGALSEGKINGKKRIGALLDLVDEIEQQWTPIMDEINEFRGEAVARVRDVFIEKLGKQVEKDLKKMPAADRVLLLDMLGDI